ncbi:MAG: 50S ribosomal protein L22 [Patescibacteria group bacterium]
MEVKAMLRHLRMSPRKVRLVIDTIRGKKVETAETQLIFVKKAAAGPVLKLLKSAVANAEHNFKLDKNTLFIKKITADAGMTIKRSMPRAMGRATPIRKRSTHITIILSDEAVPKKEKKVKPRKPIAASESK